MSNYAPTQAPATLAPCIVVVSHRALIVNQNRAESVPADYAPIAYDASFWAVRRGERVIFQTVTENRYYFPSRFAPFYGYHAVDTDPATIENTAEYTWTGKTWKQQ